MDFHVPDIKELFGLLKQYPVILVLLCGMLFGTGLTQGIKKSYLIWMPIASKPVSYARYKLSVRWLAALSTYAFTLWSWHVFIGHSGAEELVSAGWALFSPLVYDGLRAVLAWKYPDLAKHLGSSDTTGDFP